jgi:hypothetical protein
MNYTDLFDHSGNVTRFPIYRSSDNPNDAPTIAKGPGPYLVRI